MTNRRSRHAFATAAMALLMSLAGGTALAIAGGGQHDTGAQSDESYPSSQAMNSSNEPSSSATDLNSSRDSNDSTEAPDQATGYLSADSSTVMTAPPDSSSQITEGPTAISPPSNAASATPSTEPRYVPETGDAQYGSKLLPYDRTFQASPPARFNDATGQ